MKHLRLAAVGMALAGMTGCGGESKPQSAAAQDAAHAQQRDAAIAKASAADGAPLQSDKTPIHGSGGTSGHTSPQADTLRGVVAETMNSGGYTYMRIDQGGKPVWAAAKEMKLAVGDAVELGGLNVMRGFSSKTLNRTFDEILFAGMARVVSGAEADSAATESEAAPYSSNAADPHAGMGDPHGGITNPHAGMADPNIGTTDQHKTNADVVPKTPSSITVAPGDVTPLEGGFSVADLFGKKTGLVGQHVRVRGKVVKVNTGILNRTWLHIQDGTGAEGSNDITVTSTDVADLGDLVVVEGKFGIDKDIGGGYFFPVIIEDATLKIEQEK